MQHANILYFHGGKTFLLWHQMDAPLKVVEASVQVTRRSFYERAIDVPIVVSTETYVEM